MEKSWAIAKKEILHLAFISANQRQIDF
jgi:hypothetical protein